MGVLMRRLPRVCASKVQALDLVSTAPRARALRVDALDVVYHSPTFAEALLREAFHWGFHEVQVHGGSTGFLSELRAKAAERTGDYYIPVKGYITDDEKVPE